MGRRAQTEFNWVRHDGPFGVWSQEIVECPGSGGVVEALRSRVGKEFVLVRHNRAPRANRKVEVRQFRGRDFETALFDAEFDGTTIEEVA